MFEINGQIWYLAFVPKGSPYLTRDDGSVTIGMTDLMTHTIYLDDTLEDGLLAKVLRHELCHAYCISYGIVLPIEYEEVLCEAIAIYGSSIIDMSQNICNNLCKFYGKC